MSALSPLGFCGASSAGVFVKALDGSVTWLSREPANSAHWARHPHDPSLPGVICNSRVTAPEDYRVCIFYLDGTRTILGPGANIVCGARDADVWASTLMTSPCVTRFSWGHSVTGETVCDVSPEGIVVTCPENGEGLRLYGPGDQPPFLSVDAGPVRADAVAGRRNARLNRHWLVWERVGSGVYMVDIREAMPLPMLVGPRSEPSGLPDVAVPIILETAERRLTVRVLGEDDGYVVVQDALTFNPAICALGPDRYAVSWQSTQGATPETTEIRVFDYAAVPKKDLTIPLTPLTIPPHQPTIHVSVTVNGPRWVACYFGAPGDSRWDDEQGPGNCAILLHPYGGDDSQNDPANPVRFGYDYYLVHGGDPNLPILADQWIVAGATERGPRTGIPVPAEKLIGIYVGVEGGDWTDKNKADVAAARAMAQPSRVPCWPYLDRDPDDPVWQQRMAGLLPEAVGEELIPICRLYPKHPLREVDADEADWDHGLGWTTLHFRRVAIARKAYVRRDDTIALVEAYQPVQCRLANRYRVVADFPFSWHRLGGIVAPTAGMASNRLVLEPWPIAIAEAAHQHPPPARLVLPTPKPVEPPKKLSFWERWRQRRRK